METINRPEGILDYAELVQILRQKCGRDYAALEVGCQVPLYLFDLHLQYGSKRLVGVDMLKTEKAIINRYTHFAHREALEGCESIRCCHKRFLERYGPNLGLKNSQLDELSQEFENDFRIITDFDVRSSDIDPIGKFDLVLLIDILHFMTFAEARL